MLVLAANVLIAAADWYNQDTYLPLLLLDKLKCLEKEIEACREAYVPFNAMRTDQHLKRLSKKCQAAVEKKHVNVDH